MRLFACQSCQNALHFDNTICVNCHHRVGYIPDRFEMSALEQDGQSWKALSNPTGDYNFCDNAQYDVCNWLIEKTGSHNLCLSCRHNRVVPDLSVPENLQRWQRIETAKRYLFRSLLRWRLPIPRREEDAQTGLVFDLKADVTQMNGEVEKVLTGHNEGVITLNIAEADDAERENRRASMGETYRTLVGHFRHEIGHYYWDRLVRDEGRLLNSRAVFGDDSQDYQSALQKHYQSGPPANWRDSFISSYATSHPWEDFAETWAHYIHMVDALETARSYGINIAGALKYAGRGGGLEFDPYTAQSAEDLIKAWIPLTVAINGVNRSMGQPDLYPFVLSQPVMTKLQYVHDLIHGLNTAG